ncbi:hypothetical protein BKA62DRAFT_767378 [Auriculariales sp. MPI-PUGE-AT-0066]|nr:hypothetical protein BKA62DRAFT_767378 [Auriculariales sp. MPI-PUGE-AT-0066]
MRLLVALALSAALAQASGVSESVPAKPVDPLKGWFARTTTLDPQPLSVPISTLSYGVESSAWGYKAVIALFFKPDVVVDRCGTAHRIAQNESHELMDLAKELFSQSENRAKKWNMDLPIMDLDLTSVLAIVDDSDDWVQSSVYGWPTTHWQPPTPNFAYGRGDPLLYIGNLLEKWFPRPKHTGPKWPPTLDRIISLADEVEACGSISPWQERDDPLLKEVLKDRTGSLDLKRKWAKESRSEL